MMFHVWEPNNHFYFPRQYFFDTLLWFEGFFHNHVEMCSEKISDIIVNERAWCLSLPNSKSLLFEDTHDIHSVMLLYHRRHSFVRRKTYRTVESLNRKIRSKGRTNGVVLPEKLSLRETNLTFGAEKRADLMTRLQNSSQEHFEKQRNYGENKSYKRRFSRLLVFHQQDKNVEGRSFSFISRLSNVLLSKKESQFLVTLSRKFERRSLALLTRQESEFVDFYFSTFRLLGREGMKIEWNRQSRRSNDFNNKWIAFTAWHRHVLSWNENVFSDNHYSDSLCLNIFLDIGFWHDTPFWLVFQFHFSQRPSNPTFVIWSVMPWNNREVEITSATTAASKRRAVQHKFSLSFWETREATPREDYQNGNNP